MFLLFILTSDLLLVSDNIIFDSRIFKEIQNSLLGDYILRAISHQEFSAMSTFLSLKATAVVSKGEGGERGNPRPTL